MWELNIEVLNGRSLLEFFFGSRNVGVGVQYNLLRSDFTKKRRARARKFSVCAKLENTDQGLVAEYLKRLSSTALNEVPETCNIEARRTPSKKAAAGLSSTISRHPSPL